MERISKHNYYLDIAQTVSERSTCLRRRFGAIIVKNDSIISTGYNGAPRGRQNCTDLYRCVREELKIPRGERYELCRSVHAEANAIYFCAKHGISTNGTVLYITLSPCANCALAIIQAVIKTVYYAEKYRDTTGLKILNTANIETIQL